MKIEVVVVGEFGELASDCAAIGLFEGEYGKVADSMLKEFDAKTMGGRIKRAMEKGEFSGKTDSLMPLHANNGRLVLLVGLGKKEKFDTDGVRRFSGRAAASARELGSSSLAFGALPVPVADGIQAIVEGAMLGLYKFGKYKSPEHGKKHELSTLLLACLNEKERHAFEKAVHVGMVVSEAENFVRDIVNTPAKDATPVNIAEIAKGEAKKWGFKCKILKSEELADLGCGALLGVSLGSAQPPRMVVLEYSNGTGKPIALVGKGITFDSGGLNIKTPSKYMETMKDDKAGAIAVLGTFISAARLKLSVNLVGVMALAENMPGGGATKPGDVLKAYNGKTIEVLNTDAEGRLVLADALAYVTKKYKPQAAVDLATLTGACLVALGTSASGLLGNDQGLVDKIMAAGGKTHERAWQLPLWEEYGELLKSDIADVKNVVSNDAGIAGTITGASFLANFVEPGVKWAHLDIAGTAFNDKESGYLGKGATGVGVRLLVQLLMDWKNA